VLKTVIVSLQVGIRGVFASDCPFCVSGSSIFDTAFLPDCTKFCSVFSDYRKENLIRISKICLKLLFSHFKWVLEAYLPVTDFSVFLAVQSLTPLFSLTVPNFVVFFRLLNRKFNENSKNMLKTVICSLQVGLKSNFIPDG